MLVPVARGDCVCLVFGMVVLHLCDVIATEVTPSCGSNLVRASTPISRRSLPFCLCVFECVSCPCPCWFLVGHWWLCWFCRSPCAPVLTCQPSRSRRVSTTAPSSRSGALGTCTRWWCRTRQRPTKFFSPCLLVLLFASRVGVCVYVCFHSLQ